MSPQARSADDVRTKIWLKISELEPPNAFACIDGRSSLPNPYIELPGFGFLGLPLSTDDAKKIISQASQSPFGKGAETIVGTSVRKSWELNPNQFYLQHPDWNGALENVVDTVIAGLGIKKGTANVSAELNKMLLYEEGSYFKQHTDSEDVPGVFATLFICLPSRHEGGKLVLTHDNMTREFETAASFFSISYAAWYADVLYEELPVTSGYRLVLTYNLISQADFEIPLHDSSRFREQENQLSSLLKDYKSLLEQGQEELPPILVHKLKHKYTQANLKLESLEPQDLAHVSALKRISTELGFDIYLSILELEVIKDTLRCFDRGTQSLKHMVELDGKCIVKSYMYPEGALIDPTPQDAEKADEIEDACRIGKQRRPATHWYRNTVVVLVPSMKRLEFVFHFGFSGKVIRPLLCKLMQEFSKDPAQEEQLEKLCELTLQQDISGSDSVPVLFQEAATTVAAGGRFDLFDIACIKTNNKIILDNGCSLGYWVARSNLDTMNDFLMKGVMVASTVTEKVEFLKSVADGFAELKPDSPERAVLKQWSDEAILTTVKLTSLSKDDAKTLAQLCKTVKWSLFELEMSPVMRKASTICKIIFINELMSILPQDPVAEQGAFIDAIIFDIWNKFVFDSTHQEYLEDLSQIIKNTIKILSSKSVEGTIIPAMRKAIPVTSKKCAKKIFISLVRMILKNELVGFELSTDDAVPPLTHRCLVQALLMKYLNEFVGLEPPRNRSLPPHPCENCEECKDCSTVNEFLKHPDRKELVIDPCAEKRRNHLRENFPHINTLSYNAEIVQKGKITVWQITKDWRAYDNALSKWNTKTETAKQTLSQLKIDEPVVGRLEAYLHPYFGIIMNADVKELPGNKSVIATPQIPPAEIVGPLKIGDSAEPNLLPYHLNSKREASMVDFPAKRTCQSLTNLIKIE